MLKVVYYTSTSFLDTAIEIINVLKNKVELHVVIEIAPTSKRSTILSVQELTKEPALVEPAKLLDEATIRALKPYFYGVKSTRFAVHPHDNGLSFSTWKASRLVLKHIRVINPDVIHIDAKSLRFIAMVPYLLAFKKVFTTIHDPVPHSGEQNIKSRLIRFFALITAKEYFFYSVFARKQFEEFEQKNRKKKWQLSFYPLSFYKAYGSGEIVEKKQLLFFGRLSPYKGLDVLLDAIPDVFAAFPNEKLVVAGKSIDGYEIDHDKLKQFGEKIVLLNRYIPNDELVQLLNESKMVICPYKDATQSGVLMAAMALGVPVVATRIGSFPEFISNGNNGMLVPVSDAKKLGLAIQALLKNNQYMALSQNIKAANRINQWEENVPVLLKAYGAV
jgi:glycosyltransferase involved in cell wall biosynthesis